MVTFIERFKAEFDNPNIQSVSIAVDETTYLTCSPYLVQLSVESS